MRALRRGENLRPLTLVWASLFLGDRSLERVIANKVTLSLVDFLGLFLTHHPQRPVTRKYVL